MTRAQVAQLWALQQVDGEIERASAEQDALRSTLATDAAQSARAALAQARRALEARAQRERQAEAALEETRQRLQQQQERLYAGSVPAKDLDRLQREIEHLRITQATQEEDLLAAMEATEDATKVIAARQRALREVEASQSTEHERATAQLAIITARLDELRGQHAERLGDCAPELVARYEALRRSHAGRALAEVREETHDTVRAHICQGCRVRLTDAAYQRARAATELPLCPNCGRILYVP
jgi:predicted  nucleic acid-binding Zn-ribbon protein